MARGDLTVFNQAAIYIGEGIINLETDTFKLGLINNDSLEPDVDEANPRWTATYQPDEVSPIDGVDYVANGVSLTDPSLVRVVTVSTFDDIGNDIAIAQNAGGFTDGYWGILYSDTAASKEALAYIDLGGAVSQVAGPLNINWNASGIMTITRT